MLHVTCYFIKKNLVVWPFEQEKHSSLAGNDNYKPAQPNISQEKSQGKVSSVLSENIRENIAKAATMLLQWHRMHACVC